MYENEVDTIYKPPSAGLFDFARVMILEFSHKNNAEATNWSICLWIYMSIIPMRKGRRGKGRRGKQGEGGSGAAVRE